MKPFTFEAPSWVNSSLSPATPEEALQRAHDAAQAFYALGVQTGIHSVIEWCGVMTEHTLMLGAVAAQGIDPREVDQHHELSTPVPGHMVDYLCEKLGCQLKPFIRADRGRWKRAIDRWFEDGAK